MLRIRIVGAGLLTALAIALSTSLAVAQTATSGDAGPPLKLLAGLTPPHAGKTHAAKVRPARIAHAKSHRSHAARIASAGRHGRSRVALTHHSSHRIAATQAADPSDIPAASPAPVTPDVASASPDAAVVPAAPVTPAAAPSSAWPADNTAPSPAVAAPAPAQAATPADTAPVKQVVVDGRSVQVASPDEVNPLDLAADNHDADGALAHSADVSRDAPAAPAATAAPTQTVLAAPVRAERNHVGSGAWLAQALAALGGAVAAGVVAWLLIGSGPVRLYG